MHSTFYPVDIYLYDISLLETLALFCILWPFVAGLAVVAEGVAWVYWGSLVFLFGLVYDAYHYVKELGLAYF